MKKYLFCLFIPLLLWQCGELATDTELTDEERLTAYCGSCHLTPDPTSLPKAIWKESVLPEMAARLGFRYGGYQPTKGMSMQEEYDLIAQGIYPANPRIDSTDWWALHDYIIALAPESLVSPVGDSSRFQPLEDFASKEVPWPEGEDNKLTSLLFDGQSRQFLTGSARGKVGRWPLRESVPEDTFNYQFPITSDFQKGDIRYVTEVGRLNPNEASLGLLHRFGPSGHDTLINGLQRAVYTEVVDLNGNGREEILVCEFGYRTGRLSLFVPGDNGQLQQRTLFDGPGSIRTQVTDLNGDGRLDILALTAQGDESIRVFYQEEELRFRAEQIIRLPAVYGTSWFELFDYEGDGDLDIAVVNGDNADHSNIPKPYHGFRLFLNDGQKQFSEAYFFPLNGCTRFVAHDFDGDGDVDFALTAYFAEFVRQPATGFVYLENRDAARFDFTPHTTEAAAKGRWLLLEKGDYDSDGDTDIALGSFLLEPGLRYPGIMQNWVRSGVDLLILDNLAGR